MISIVEYEKRQAIREVHLKAVRRVAMRDMFAAAALKNFHKLPTTSNVHTIESIVDSRQTIARDCYAMADAMIAVREVGLNKLVVKPKRKRRKQ